MQRFFCHNAACSIPKITHLLRLRRGEDGDLDLDTWLERDGGDLLDNLRRGVEVDQPLVDSHLVVRVSLRTFTAGGLPGGVAQDLGGQSDGALNSQLLVLGSGDQVIADLLEVLDIARGESDSDSVDLGRRGGGVDVLVVLGDVTHNVLKKERWVMSQKVTKAVDGRVRDQVRQRC